METVVVDLVDFGSTLWPRWIAQRKRTLCLRRHVEMSNRPMYKRSVTWAGETSKLRPMELTRELRISALCEELPRELYAWVGEVSGRILYRRMLN